MSGDIHLMFTSPVMQMWLAPYTESTIRASTVETRSRTADRDLIFLGSSSCQHLHQTSCHCGSHDAMQKWDKFPCIVVSVLYWCTDGVRSLACEEWRCQNTSECNHPLNLSRNQFTQTVFENYCLGLATKFMLLVTDTQEKYVLVQCLMFQLWEFLVIYTARLKSIFQAQIIALYNQQNFPTEPNTTYLKAVRNLSKKLWTSEQDTYFHLKESAVLH